MTIAIDWAAFVQVFLAALLGATAVVTSYAVGLRLLVRSGRVPVVSPATFTDAITVISDKELRRATKRAEKAARKSPLSPGQKLWAFLGACACFALCIVAIVGGILIIIIAH